MTAQDAVITVEGLSKSYLVGHESAGPERYGSLRDSLVRQAKNLARKTADMARGRQIIQGDEVEEFWALRDVSFEVARGEVLGIVGRNGAGKSTLLKILSRITEPTTGRVRIRGRVASLLEVGTGFHPELTGRENIFLNGSILGMTRSEIKAKFDEIVAFAEIDKFLDTPVKRYSSGMYVRLAFAVAAHLEPEILVVDEVLAVGDFEFQRKCLGKMKDVSRHDGRTVLFVSHNIAAVKALCSKGLYLESGRLRCWGTVEAAVGEYIGAGSDAFNGTIPRDLPRQYATGEAELRSVQIIDRGGSVVQAVVTGEPIHVRVQWEVAEPLARAMIEVGINDQEGRQITQSFSSDGGAPPIDMKHGPHEIRLEIQDTVFPGRYSLLAGIHRMDGTTVDFVERAFDFEVLNAGSDDPAHYPWTVRGYLRPAQRWTAPVLPSESDNGTPR
ncbi:MAG: ABC transporter ATP-binding protein [Gemmatimonadaceae bacterium]|nr:ABC transporter ATP-binding protein [Gemmatimonadaceae bacterium]